MSTSHDDLEAIRSIIDTLTPFDDPEKTRIIRWVCEKLAIGLPQGQATTSSMIAHSLPPAVHTQEGSHHGRRTTDIKSFVNSKSPSSDMQFAATIAYYYAFESPEAERKEEITDGDLLDACRLLGRERLKNPGQTLRNAAFNGLLDKGSGRGNYKINTVGENLVAVTLPGGNESASTRKPKKQRTAKTKPPVKKSNKKKTTKAK